MTQSTFTGTSAPSSGLAGWALSKALAPLLRLWRQPRSLRPDELSDGSPQSTHSHESALDADPARI